MIEPKKIFKNTGLESEIEKLIDDRLKVEWDEDEVCRVVDIKVGTDFAHEVMYFMAMHFMTKYRQSGWTVNLQGGRMEKSGAYWFAESKLVFDRPMIEHSGLPDMEPHKLFNFRY